MINPSASECASMEVSNSAITEGNGQFGLQWGWDDDDRDTGMDIQALLSEFGDFGDFFENDALPFGEVVILSIVGKSQSRHLHHICYESCQGPHNPQL